MTQRSAAALEAFTMILGPQSVRGMRSGQTTKSYADLENEARMKSVVRHQGHRQWAEDPDDPMLESPFGRFCIANYADKALRLIRFRGGEDFARDVEDWRVAYGLKPTAGQKSGASSKYYGLDVEQMRAAVQAAYIVKKNAEAALRAVDGKTVTVVTDLCWGRLEVSPYDEGRVRNGLYRLSLHYGHEKRPFHET